MGKVAITPSAQGANYSNPDWFWSLASTSLPYFFNKDGSPKGNERSTYGSDSFAKNNWLAGMQYGSPSGFVAPSWWSKLTSIPWDSLDPTMRWHVTNSERYDKALTEYFSDEEKFWKLGDQYKNKKQHLLANYMPTIYGFNMSNTSNFDEFQPAADRDPPDQKPEGVSLSSKNVALDAFKEINDRIKGLLSVWATDPHGYKMDDNYKFDSLMGYANKVYDRPMALVPQGLQINLPKATKAKTKPIPPGAQLNYDDKPVMGPQYTTPSAIMSAIMRDYAANYLKKNPSSAYPTYLVPDDVYDAATPEQQATMQQPASFANPATSALSASNNQGLFSTVFAKGTPSMRQRGPRLTESEVSPQLNFFKGTAGLFAEPGKDTAGGWQADPAKKKKNPFLDALQNYGTMQ